MQLKSCAIFASAIGSLVTHLSCHKLLHRINIKRYVGSVVKRSEDKITVEGVDMLISEPSRAAQFLSLVILVASSGHRAPRCAVERRDYTVHVALCTMGRLLSGVVILAH